MKDRRSFCLFCPMSGSWGGASDLIGSCRWGQGRAAAWWSMMSRAQEGQAHYRFVSHNGHCIDGIVAVAERVMMGR